MKKKVYEFGKQCRILSAYDIYTDDIVVRISIQINKERYSVDARGRGIKRRLSQKHKISNCIKRLYEYVAYKEPMGLKKVKFVALPLPEDKIYIIQEGVR